MIPELRRRIDEQIDKFLEAWAEHEYAPRSTCSVCQFEYRAGTACRNRACPEYQPEERYEKRS